MALSLALQRLLAGIIVKVARVPRRCWRSLTRPAETVHKSRGIATSGKACRARAQGTCAQATSAALGSMAVRRSHVRLRRRASVVAERAVSVVSERACPARPARPAQRRARDLACSARATSAAPGGMAMALSLALQRLLAGIIVKVARVPRRCWRSLTRPAETV